VLLVLSAAIQFGCNFSSEALDNANGAGLTPVVNAGNDQSVVENTLLQLGGTAQGGEGSLVFSWTQVSGPTVSILDPDTLRASFIAPNIDAGTTASVVLRLTVTDSGARSASDDVSATVTEVPPGADAGPDRESFEQAPVILSGNAEGSDVPLDVFWSQVSGPDVSIADAGMPEARFTAPDVPLNSSEVLVFRFSVTDAVGRIATDDIAITVSEQPTTVSISGTLHYEYPAPNANCDGLNFSGATLRPIRQATVQLVDSNTFAVVGSTVSDDAGMYSFISNSQSSVFVRVRAELKRANGPAWDVEVRDNTSSTVLPFEQRPLYVLDGPPSSPSGANEVRNLVAVTGWSGLGFTGVRSAAPFSILDAAYISIQLVVASDASANFSPLDIFWSVNNTTALGDIDIGEIGTSFYRSDINSLFLLGQDGDDIDEFDQHVIAHEWSHYFEDTFSRSDNIGGAHGPGDRLDARVAFSEGFATAYAGMALDDPLYCDALWSQGILRGFRIDIESEVTMALAGWYNEASIMKILFDLWDTDNDGADTSSIGFGPIYSVLVGSQVSTDSFTTFFSFAESLKSMALGQDAFIDALLAGENIVASGIDRWGSTENNNAGSGDALPVFKILPADGTVLNVCSNSEFDSVGLAVTGNKLNVHQLLRLDIAIGQRYTFSAQADAGTLSQLPPDDPANAVDQSDPDLFFFLNGERQNAVVGTDLEGQSNVANSEVFSPSAPLTVGTYVVDFVDFRHEDANTDGNYPLRTCFDITVAPAP
jgi:hypothetical protein